MRAEKNSEEARGEQVEKENPCRRAEESSLENKGKLEDSTTEQRRAVLRARENQKDNRRAV